MMWHACDSRFPGKEKGRVAHVLVFTSGNLSGHSSKDSSCSSCFPPDSQSKGALNETQLQRTPQDWHRRCGTSPGGGGSHWFRSSHSRSLRRTSPSQSKTSSSSSAVTGTLNKAFAGRVIGGVFPASSFMKYSAV